MESHLRTSYAVVVRAGAGLVPRFRPVFFSRIAALGLAISLAACGQERVVLTPPPLDRTEPIAYPAVPDGEALCDGAPCLSDRQTGQIISDLMDVVDAANAKLIWLREWAKALAE